MEATEKMRRARNWVPVIAGISSRGEFFMLHCIGAHEEHLGEADSGIKISDLSSHMKMSMPAVSQMINLLEDKGYVERYLTKKDRRVVYVHLTPTGKDEFIKQKKHVAAIMDQIMDRIGETDIDELIRLLNKFYDTMEEMRQEKKTD